jgi:hypothetical protein
LDKREHGQPQGREGPSQDRRSNPKTTGVKNKKVPAPHYTYDSSLTETWNERRMVEKGRGPSGLASGLGPALAKQSISGLFSTIAPTCWLALACTSGEAANPVGCGVPGGDASLHRASRFRFLARSLCAGGYASCCVCASTPNYRPIGSACGGRGRGPGSADHVLTGHGIFRCGFIIHRNEHGASIHACRARCRVPWSH